MEPFPPALGLSSEQTEQLLRLAGAAPSLHNRQPWRFRLSPESIELFCDPRRRLPAADPDDRELRVGCGAALLNLRIALAQAGIRPDVTLVPRTGGPWALAHVRVAEHADPAPPESELFRAIPVRRSNRRPFLPDPVPLAHCQALVRAVQAEDCWLHVVERSQLGVLENLVRTAHRAQLDDPAFVAEMLEWTGRGPGEVEGVPAASAGPLPEPQDQWVLRDFSGGQARIRLPGKDFEYDPLLLVLCSHSGTRTADLEAGQALQRMLLTATSLGLVASLISQVTEVGEVREELRRLLGGSLHPQAVVRVGYGTPAPATPRREPRELLVDQAGA
ncbi:Acg family FMN-binding oxidoreductase [Saccharopolyspora taberi]|uniref:Nitroreductase family protein n=1 Tax=Saccharopolyspora taberi TaxID=60895 RepID=A0ABN3VA84_9PSEU